MNRPHLERRPTPMRTHPTTNSSSSDVSLTLDAYELGTPLSRRYPVNAYPRYSLPGLTALDASACALHSVAGPSSLMVTTLCPSPTPFFVTSTLDLSAYPLRTNAFTNFRIPAAASSTSPPNAGSGTSKSVPSNPYRIRAYVVSPKRCANTAGRSLLSDKFASLRITLVVPSAPDRSSNTLRDRGISLATTLNWVYEMKSKYSGSVSLPCSILSGEYCWVYGSHSLCRDFQKLI
mmetsp:Transcript_2825/g.11542  ORF Transcript_2825/g.11542 Transcript_2825/m.11542 type:complete len:234 (-) Transcript_2825:571-1272(-)